MVNQEPTRECCDACWITHFRDFPPEDNIITEISTPFCWNDSCPCHSIKKPPERESVSEALLRVEADDISRESIAMKICKPPVESKTMTEVMMEEREKEYLELAKIRLRKEGYDQALTHFKEVVVKKKAFYEKIKRISDTNPISPSYATPVIHVLDDILKEIDIKN